MWGSVPLRQDPVTAGPNSPGFCPGYCVLKPQYVGNEARVSD